MEEKFHKDLGGDYFYCYSRRCAFFIRAMGIFYEGSVYTKFHKTKKLNEILKLWDDIKYRFDNMLDDGTVVKDYGQNCR